MAKPHILIVDDDARLRELLQQFLREQGFAVTSAEHAADARRKLALFVFDLMVLDVMMPGETGLEFMRASGSSLPPVLLLTAMAGPEDRIQGLEAGVDDYLVKPFEPKELVLRIQAILRRTREQAARRRSVRFGDFRFDLTQARLYRLEEPVHLTTGESQLLRQLAETPGEPVSREILARSLAGGQGERGVDVQVTRLRKKIEADSGRPLHIQTVRGEGYVLSAVREG